MACQGKLATPAGHSAVIPSISTHNARANAAWSTRSSPDWNKASFSPTARSERCSTRRVNRSKPVSTNSTLSDLSWSATCHRAYIAAGSDLIETNTFGANRARLEQFHLADKVKVINKRAVKLAREEREISGKQVLIAGSLGPTMRTIAPLGTTPAAEVRSIYSEQIEALLEGGVDLLVFETIGSLDEMVAAIEAAKAACDLPIVAMMTFAEDAPDDGRAQPNRGRRYPGRPRCHGGRSELLGRSAAHPAGGSVDAPSLEASRVETLARAGLHAERWLAVPRRRQGDLPSSPDYFASFATEAADAGVRIIGGCCGTTPDHIAAMRAALDTWAGTTESAVTTVTIPGPTHRSTAHRI